MLKKWVLRDPAHPISFLTQTGLSPLAALLLTNRGIATREAADAFLNPSSQDMGDPMKVSGVAAAVQRIRASIASKEKIMIYGDYDVDGSAGSAILYLAIQELGGNVRAFIPDRAEHGYGLNASVVQKFEAEEVRLVIAVDNGISAVREIDHLNSKKIDVILVDHHLPKAELPAAKVIVGVDAAGKPDTEFTASGLAYMLAWALLGDESRAVRHLDLAALGTIADLAPLRRANRALVRLGLVRLACTEKPGLKALLESAEVLGAVSADDVAFLLAPRLNAAGRVGSSRDAFLLMIVSDLTEAHRLAGVLGDANKQRQKLEQEAFSEAVDRVEATHHFGREPVIVVADDRWHEGIVGIIASRLVERYHRPSYVIGLRNGSGKGSGRSIRGFHMFRAMVGCGDVFEKFGGHEAACGFTVSEEKIAEFRKRINEIARKELLIENLVPRLDIDAELELGSLDESVFLSDLAQLEPFGMDNARPLFFTRGLKVKGKAKALGRWGGALSMEDPRNGRGFDAYFFRRRPEFKEGDTVDLVYRPYVRREDGKVGLAAEDADFSRTSRK